MAVADVPFDLAEAKLAAPLPRPGTVAKADVIARLSAAKTPFATVVAPAGYGKTTLLARWAETDPRPFAWVALDGRDDDAVVFLRYIAAAMHRLEPVSPDVFEALSGPGGSTWSTRVPRVGGAIAARERPLVLALDDLHAVANPACLDVLAELSRYVPAGSQIAVASREEPALPLGRWRAQGSVDEIGVGDLRLDEQEAGMLLAEAGVELDADEVSELTERTEGWPAGLYLAALSMRAGGAGSVTAEGFTGGDRFVSEYFRLELLSRLPEAEAQFLKHTSILERMCGGLCDAVLETTGSAHALETLERANGFVVPLDRTGEWYRYHHLFGQLLRNELERTEPEVVPALNARALAWCVANDLPEEAVGYGQAAGETEAVAGLIDALSPPLYYDGRLQTAEEWLGWFGDDELVRLPRACRLRSLVARADGASRGGRALARPRRRGDLEDPALGRQRHDRAVGRHAARAHDAERCRAGARRRRSGAGSALAGQFLDPDRTPRPRSCARPARRHRSCSGGAFRQPSSEGWPPAASKRSSWRTRSSRSSRPRREPGVRQGNAHGQQKRSSRSRASATTRRARSRTSQRRGSRSTRRGRKMPARRWCVPTACGPCSTTAFPGKPSASGSSSRASISRSARPPPPARSLRETEDVLELRPDLGSLVEDARELRDRLAATSGSAGAWAMSLTGAELRLLPYLATHLTVPEIATRLFISRNTVKTEAVSIYRKLDASSRSQAIERAVEVGLLDGSIYPPPANLTQEG